MSAIPPEDKIEQDKINAILDKLFQMRKLIQASMEVGVTAEKLNGNASDLFAPRELHLWLKQLSHHDKETYEAMMGAFWTEFEAVMKASRSQFEKIEPQKDILENLLAKYPHASVMATAMDIQNFKKMSKIDLGREFLQSLLRESINRLNLIKATKDRMGITIFKNAKRRKKDLLEEIKERQQFNRDLVIVILNMQKDMGVKSFFRKHAAILENLIKKMPEFKGIMEQLERGEPDLKKAVELLEVFYRIIVELRLRKLQQLMKAHALPMKKSFGEFVKDLKEKGAHGEASKIPEPKIEESIVISLKPETAETPQKRKDLASLERECKHLEGQLQKIRPEALSNPEVQALERLTKDLHALIMKKREPIVEDEFLSALHRQNKKKDSKAAALKKTKKEYEIERKKQEEEARKKALVNQDPNELTEILENHPDFVLFLERNPYWLTGGALGVEYQNEKFYTLRDAKVAFSFTYLNNKRIEILAQLFKRIEARKQIIMRSALPGDPTVLIFDRVLADLDNAINARLKPILDRIKEVDPNADVRIFKLFKKKVNVSGQVSYEASKNHTMTSLLEVAKEGIEAENPAKLNVERLLYQYVAPRTPLVEKPKKKNQVLKRESNQDSIQASTQERKLGLDQERKQKLEDDGRYELASSTSNPAREQLRLYLSNNPLMVEFLDKSFNSGQFDQLHQNYMKHLELKKKQAETRKKEKNEMMVPFSTATLMAREKALESILPKVEPLLIKSNKLKEEETELKKSLKEALDVNENLQKNQIRLNEVEKMLKSTERTLKQYFFMLKNYLDSLKAWALVKGYWGEQDDKVIAEYESSNKGLNPRAEVMGHFRKRFIEFRGLELRDDLVENAKALEAKREPKIASEPEKGKVTGPIVTFSGPKGATREQTNENGTTSRPPRRPSKPMT